MRDETATGAPDDAPENAPEGEPRPPSPPAGTECCRNCGAVVDTAFCPACGQRRVTGPLRTSEIVGDLLSSAVDVDRGFLRTFIGLIRAPGDTALEYVGGRRAAHAPPFRYFLLMLAAWAAFPTLIGFDYTAFATKGFAEAQTAVPVGDGVGSEAIRSILDRFEAASLTMYEWRRWTVLANLPLYAGGGWLLFRKRTRTFAEWTAFALYVSAQTLVLGMVGFVLLSLGWEMINHVVSMGTFPYVIWAYRGFTRESWLAASVKGLLVMFGGGTILFAVMMGVALALGG